MNADCEAGCVHEEVAKRIPNVRFIRTDLESVNPMMRLHSILRAASDLYGWRGLVSGRRERSHKPDTGNRHNDTGKCEALAWGKEGQLVFPYCSGSTG